MFLEMLKGCAYSFEAIYQNIRKNVSSINEYRKKVSPTADQEELQSKQFAVTWMFSKIKIIKLKDATPEQRKILDSVSTSMDFLYSISSQLMSALSPVQLKDPNCKEYKNVKLTVSTSQQECLNMLCAVVTNHWNNSSLIFNDDSLPIMEFSILRTRFGLAIKSLSNNAIKFNNKTVKSLADIPGLVAQLPTLNTERNQIEQEILLAVQNLTWDGTVDSQMLLIDNYMAWELDSKKNKLKSLEQLMNPSSNTESTSSTSTSNSSSSSSSSSSNITPTSTSTTTSTSISSSSSSSSSTSLSKKRRLKTEKTEETMELSRKRIKLDTHATSPSNLDLRTVKGKETHVLNKGSQKGWDQTNIPLNMENFPKPIQKEDSKKTLASENQGNYIDIDEDDFFFF